MLPAKPLRVFPQSFFTSTLHFCLLALEKVYDADKASLPYHSLYFFEQPANGQLFPLSEPRGHEVPCI